MSAELAELAEARARLAETPCPDWCDMPQHAETRSGTWHEGANTAVQLTSGGSPLYCEVSEGHDMGGAWDLRLSICADAGKVSASEAREFAAGILRAADLLDRLTAEAAA